MAESDMKEQIAAVLAEIREQSTKIDGLANKMEAVEGKVGSMEEIKPVIIDLALWKPKVDQAVGALQADLGNLRVHLDRLVQHASTTPAPPPLPSPVDRRPDLRVQVGDDGRHGPGGHRVDINSRGSVMGPPPHMTPAKGCGVDFIRLRWAGIDGFRLRWLLRDSGLFRARASWATFTGAYHVAYFVSMMFGETLPADVDTFMGMVRKLFRSPSVYDVKRLAKEHDKKCVGSLVDITKQLAVVLPNERDWRSKLAGRGSMLALLAFETLKQKLGANTEKYRDELCRIQVI